MSKMKPCKTCQTEVSKSAVVCPNCGQKLKMGCGMKLLISAGIIVVLGIIGAMLPNTDGGSSGFDLGNATPIPIADITYAEIDEIYNLESDYTDLQKDAQWENYEGKRVQWTGKVSSLDESFGTLILQVKMNDSSFLADLLVRLNDDQKDTALTLTEGDSVEFIGTLNEWGTLIPITLNDAIIVK